MQHGNGLMYYLMCLYDIITEKGNPILRNTIAIIKLRRISKEITKTSTNFENVLKQNSSSNTKLVGFFFVLDQKVEFLPFSLAEHSMAEH